MLISLLLASFASAQTPTSLYPEVQHFKDVAEFTIPQIQRESSTRDWLLALHHELAQTGVAILGRYQIRYPECGEQLSVLRKELPKIRGLKIADVMARYHDGIGLPAAPAHCIYGRVYVVHPLVNLIRIEQATDAIARNAMAADLQELLQYLPKLQHNLEPEAPKETRP